MGNNHNTQPTKAQRFKKLKTATRGILVLTWLFFSLDLLWPIISPIFNRQLTPRLPPQAGVNYLIIAPEGLAASAHEWEKFRQTTGYQTQTIILSAVDARSPALIRKIVLDTYRLSQSPDPFFLLIIGHAHADSPDYDAFIAPARITLPKSAVFIFPIKRVYSQCQTSMDCETIPGDDGFITENDETFLPIAVGRIPAKNNQEVLSVLERTKEYEQFPPQGENLTHVELLASDSLWGDEFNAMMELGLKILFTQFLSPEYQLHFLYGSQTSNYSVPAEKFSQEAIRRFDADPTLLVYAGHGLHNRVGPVFTADKKRLQVLTIQDTTQISHAEHTIAFAIACLAGAYDLPKDMGDSLAEALILSPKGPVGVYAASRISFAVDNLLIGEEMFWRKTHPNDATLGELLSMVENSYQFPETDTAFALWAGKSIFIPIYQIGEWAITRFTNNEDNFSPQKIAVWHRYEYNLFGDPALKLSIPRHEIKLDSPLGQFTWDPEINFSGSAPLPPGSNVTVSLAVPLDRTLPRELSPKKDSSVYEAVNQRLVARVYVPIDEQGSFAGKIKFPAALPAGKYYLLAMAVDGQITQTGYQATYYRTLPIDIIPPSISGLIITSVILCGLKLRKSKKLHGGLVFHQRDQLSL